MIYIIQTVNESGDILIKLGYSIDNKRRLYQYKGHNPFTKVLYTDSFYNDDIFEKGFHQSHKSEVMREWYREDMFGEMIDCINKFKRDGLKPVKKLRGSDVVLFCLQDIPFNEVLAEIKDATNEDRIGITELKYLLEKLPVYSNFISKCIIAQCDNLIIP